jgi:hypothetical protein
MEPPRRDIYEIIKKILEIIPKEEEILIKSLNNYVDNKLPFMPPEYLFSYQSWKPLTDILNKNISDIKEEWQIKIRYIINGKI